MLIERSRLDDFAAFLFNTLPPIFPHLRGFFQQMYNEHVGTSPNPSLPYSPSAFFMTKILPELSNVDIDPVECSLKLARWRREVISLTRT